MTITHAGFAGTIDKIAWSRLITLLGFESSSGFGVTAVAGDRTVSVATGRGNVGGILARITSPETYQFPENDSATLSRIDLLLLRANWTAKTLTLTHREGTRSVTPQPPTPRRDEGDLWDLVLAEVTIGPGQGALSSGNIRQANVEIPAGFYHIDTIGRAPDASQNPALVFYNPAKSLRVAVGNDYVEIANARQQQAFGHLTSVNFNAQGAVTEPHGLGWKPDHMVFTPYLAGGAGAVDVFPSSISTRFTDTVCTIVAKDVGTGNAYTGSISTIGFIAYRNL